MSTVAPPRPLIEPLWGEADHRLTPTEDFRGTAAFVLDVPETIPQLGYGSHQFFRYYGKFPSVVGAEIIARHGRSEDVVLDCYAGCGTTLVEAQSAGLSSFGMDINPLAVLACNVKTSYPNVVEVRAGIDRVLRRASGPGTSPAMPRSLSDSRLEKWFDPSARRELALVRNGLLAEPEGPVRQFLLTAFLGVVRRVSNAYDGEVRPHVNPAKAKRSALRAFAKKANEMAAALVEVDELRPSGVVATSALADNRDSAAYRRLLGERRPGLVVAHPPYLNSFNYLQVFSLELAWAEDFPELWDGLGIDELRCREHRAWPATNEPLRKAYYDDFETAMQCAVDVSMPDARFAVVIGDATIRGELEPVHTRFWEILEGLGLRPIEVWYRTTHYGIGKYAYRNRADYHGAEAEKRDAVLFFGRS